MSMSREMPVKSTVTIQESSFRVVWTMERHADSDLLFAGSDGGIGVVFFTGDKLQVLRVIAGKREMDRFVDLHWMDDCLYAMDEPSEVFYKFDFSDLTADEKQFRSKAIETARIEQLSKDYGRHSREIMLIRGRQD